MQLNILPPGQDRREISVTSLNLEKKVVRNKNTGKSFWVRGENDGSLELVPIQGEDLSIPVQDFTSASWEIVR